MTLSQQLEEYWQHRTTKLARRIGFGYGLTVGLFIGIIVGMHL